MLIEFNGLPGSGKTTIAHFVFDLIKQNEMKTILLQDSIRSFSKHKFKLFFINLWALFFKRSLRVFRAYCKLSKQALNNNKYCKRVLLNFLRNYNICLFLANKHQNSIIISDQFVFQSIVSVLFDCLPKDYSIIQSLITFLQEDFKNCIFVDVDLESNESCKRITERKTNGGRLDSLEGNQLYDALFIQERIIADLRKNTKRENVLLLDSHFTPRENSQIIYEDLKRRIDL